MARAALSFFLPFLAGFIGMIATDPSLSTWYASLNKPSFNPPNEWFGPVWTLLYLLMGIALYRIWTPTPITPRARAAVKLFIAHLALNSLWSILFFGLQNPLLALLDIIILWILIVILIKRFKHIDPLASWLLVPYLLWVSFATLLNASIVYLN